MEVFQNLDVKKIILIPSYNETEALNHFLNRLLPMCSKEVAVVICDDSEELARDYIGKLVKSQITMNKCSIFVDFSEVKTGRCHAVVRGLRLTYEKFPSAEFFVECDADESHQVTDVMKILEDSHQSDFLIGSRYLPSSKIIGWPLSRRIFSRILNLLIPKLLGIKTTDVTNGLRRYSRKSVEQILALPLKTRGFITLSEIAVRLSERGFDPVDVPTIFVNRRFGKSTVTKKEIINSAKGLVSLLFARD